MIGIILIYFLGKYFYELAKKHDKSAWGYAILGVVTYYGGVLIGGVILGVILVFWNFDVDSVNEFFIGLLALPFGILCAYLLYKYLEKKWSNTSLEQFNDILDQDFINDDINLK